MKKILIGISAVILVFIMAMVAIIGGTGGNNNCEITSIETPGQGTGGNWTNKNSQVYKDMMYTVEHMKALGFSGDQTAVALSIGNKESGFNPKALNTGGGVAGVYQWSGWVHNVNGNRIVSEGSIKAGDMSTLTLENEIKLLKFELKGTYKHVYTQFLATTTMTEAERVWSTGYEGLPEGDEAQRKTLMILKDAQSIKKALNLDFASSGANSGLGQDAVENGKENNEEAGNIADLLSCDPVGSVSGQGSGVPSERVPKYWVDKIEFDDDRTVTYSDNKYPFGQCTWYVYDRMKHVGTPIEWFPGDGGNGGNWGDVAQKAGYKVTKNEPVVGSAVSFKGGQYGSVAPYGHIAFVEAVKDDGSFLVSEANVVSPGSGKVSFREFKSGKGLTFISGKE